MTMTNKISPNLDPRLQKAIVINQTRETNALHEIAHENNLVPVIAKVTNVDAFYAIPGVHQGEDITMAPDKSGRIVTARVSVTELEKVRQSPVVLSLKGAQPLKPLLKDTVREIGVPPLLGNEGGGGEGVIVGIVDHGCDFVHRNFRREDGSTRLIALYDQINRKIYSKQKINEALQTPNPYATLGYDVSKEDPQRRTRAEHGTHVMDIAAGNGLGTGNRGVASHADLIFVEPAYFDVSEEGNFGDSSNLLEAIKFIFSQAGDQPCVVNISLGTNGGPHDGTSHVEQGIDGLVLEKPNRAVVIAAGNSFDDNIHATGSISQGEFVDLHWMFKDGDFTTNELEIWYDGDDEFRLEILNTENESIGSIGLGENESFDEGQIFATQVKNDEENGDNVAMVFYPLRGDVSKSTWTIRLHGVRVTNGEFHAWIERDNFQTESDQSSFAPPNNNTHTLGSICCGHKSIVVGSYDAKFIGTPISSFSSSGPTRDRRQKPEISAPGGTREQPVQAASSRTREKLIGMAGTSMAAPAVTGVIALMLAEAKARGLTLTVDQIRSILKQTARPHPPATEGWHDRYGYGRIDAKAAVEAIKAMVVPLVGS
ncbi:peptidase S8 [Paenibacillus peoriae]|nr:peptidase S8 [Paenibacillus peoriae]